MTRPTTAGPEAGFLLTVPQLQTWRDAEGAPHFEGVAASTSIDRQSERLTPEALADMQRFSGMDLLPSHDAGALDELGVVERCWVDGGRLRIAGRLDPGNPEALRLHQRLQAGRRYGLSVGGRVLKAHWEYDPQAAGRVRCIDRVELDHVAVCRPGAAANPDTWLGALAKAAEAVTETSSASDSPSPAASAKERGSGGEAAVPTPHAEAAHVEDAALTSLAKALLDACRKLWPFSADPSEQPCASTDQSGYATAAGGDPAQTEPQPAPTLEAASLAALHKQLDDLADALEGLRKQLPLSPSAAAQAKERGSGGESEDTSADEACHIPTETSSSSLSPSPAAPAKERGPGGEAAAADPDADATSLGRVARASSPSPEATDPDELVVPGQPQHLPGQTSSANHGGPHESGPQIWKGVL